jgi:hypothetical protein
LIKTSDNQGKVEHMSLHKDASYQLIDGEKKSSEYEPQRIQFKAPSEHTWFGQQYDLELQIYSKSKVSVPADVTKEDTAASSILFKVKKCDEVIQSPDNFAKCEKDLQRSEPFFKSLKLSQIWSSKGNVDLTNVPLKDFLSEVN